MPPKSKPKETDKIDHEEVDDILPDNDDPNDDNPSDNGDEDGDDDKFDALLGRLTGAGKKDNSSSDMMMLMMMEDKREARREAREARREAKAQQDMMIKLMLQMAQPKGTDPLLTEVIKATLSGNNQKELLQNTMDMQRNNAQANMDMMKATLESTMKVKDEMMRDALEIARENGEKSKETISPAMEIFREIRLMAEPILANKFGPQANAAPTQTAIANEPAKLAQPVVSEKERLPLVLRAMMNIQKNDKLSNADKRSMRAKLAIIIMDIPNLARLICDEKSDEIFELCKPYVLADSELANWVGMPGIGEWINDFLTKQLAPLLDSMLEAEEIDNDIETDDNSGDNASDNSKE